MKDWELFELEAVKYLNQSFVDCNVKFINAGGSNSEVPDINVLNHNKEILFNLEAKLSPSQSGQFVILKDNGKFKLTQLSKLDNPHSQEIIDFLNLKSTGFIDFDDGVMNVNCDNNLLANWIKFHYYTKNSQFIITSVCLKGFKAIIPIEELENYFDITACVRRKKSGTSHLSKSRFHEGVTNAIKHLKGMGEDILEVTQKDKKTLVYTKNLIGPLSKAKRYFGDDLFLSPEKSRGVYAIKKLSSTNNINVIFSLVFIGEHQNYGLELLRSYIKK